MAESNGLIRIRWCEAEMCLILCRCCRCHDAGQHAQLSKFVIGVFEIKMHNICLTEITSCRGMVLTVHPTQMSVNTAMQFSSHDSRGTLEVYSEI